MERLCLLGSALLLLLLAQASAELFALPPSQDSPDDAAAGFYAPPTLPSSPPDAKTPETIMQLSGTTSLAACAALQEFFSDLLDSGNIFSRNQLCYLSALNSSSSSTSPSTGSSSTGAAGPTQNQTSTDNSSSRPLYWFILSAVLPSFEVADRAVLTMGHVNGPDIDSFLDAAGVPCGDQLIATTQTEDQDTASVFVYSCNGMLALPGSSVPLTLPALCCTTTPRPPRQASPPLPPSALPPWIEEVEPPPTEPPRSPPSPTPARAPSPRFSAKRPPPPPPPGTIDRAQLTLFVMAPPDRLYCSKLLMACETLAQPYGLAYGNYSCRASYDLPAAEARYGATASTAASVVSAAAAAASGTAANASVVLTSPYMIVKLSWPARAYSRHFKRLQSALASSVDVFASLGLVPCGTEIRAVLLATSGAVDREDAFGCNNSLPDDYQTALMQRGLRVLPRQQLCCRPPPPPVPPPLPPPRPPPPPRRLPVGPPAPSPSTPAPQPSTPPPASPTPVLQPAPSPPPGRPMSSAVAPVNPYDWGRPPPEARDSSTYGEVVGGGTQGATSTSMPQASESFQTQGLSREAIAVIAVLAAAAVLSLLAALFVLYRRRQSPLRAAAAAAIDAAGLPPIIGYGDDFGGGAAAVGGGGRQLPSQPRHAQQSGLLGGWEPGKDSLAMGLKAQAARGGGSGVERGPGSGPPGGGGGGGGLLAMSTSVGSSELTEQSSAGEGLPALMREAATEAAAAAAAEASLELRDGTVADSVALVRAFTIQRPPPPAAAAAAGAAGMGMSPAVWAPPQGVVAAPDGSGFGLMDVFRGAAANHICLSAATSAAPSAAGVLEAAGVPPPQPRGGSGSAPLGNGGDARSWSAFHNQEPTTRQQQQQRRDGNDGGEVLGATACRPGPAGRAAERRGQGAAAAAPTHGSEQQWPQPQEPGYRPAAGATALQHAREVTLLELFNQSPLAGAMLCTPSNSSGGAPPSPTGMSRSLSPTARRASGGGAGGAAAALPASRSASLSGLRQHSSPAIALERLSVQLAWNIARLSCSVSEAQGGDGDGDDDDNPVGVRGDDTARQNRGDRRPDGLRSSASGPQPRLRRWTSPRAASGAEDSASGAPEGVGSTGGSSGSGAGCKSAAASEAPASGGGRSSGTSATAATSSVGAVPSSSGWGQGGVLSPEASSPAPVPLVRPPPRPHGSRFADAATGAAKPASVGAPGVGGGGGGKFTCANGGGVDLDISPKELRIQTDGLLGAGAFGSVYRGSYRGQPVAIKVLHHLHFAAGAEGAAGGGAAGGGGIGPGGGALLQQKDVDSFRQEIAILRMLAHPNIVRVLGGCAHAGHPFLVMELMPRCLHNVIHGAAGGGLALADALRIATDVARGLAHLHPAIVHRDLKPANILLDAGGTAKISDFGLARYHLKPYISTQQPDAGSVAYMAPEGFDPAIGRLSAKCDVYSFGVLLWELITKEHPWAGESNVAIIYRVAVHRMRLPVPADPRVCPPRLAALLDGCMSYLPSDRPDMRHVLSELEGMLRIVQEGGVETLMAAGPGPSRPEAAVRPPPPPPPSMALARAPPPSQAHQGSEGVV